MCWTYAFNNLFIIKHVLFIMNHSYVDVLIYIYIYITWKKYISNICITSNIIYILMNIYLNILIFINFRKSC